MDKNKDYNIDDILIPKKIYWLTKEVFMKEIGGKEYNITKMWLSKYGQK